MSAYRILDENTHSIQHRSSLEFQIGLWLRLVPFCFVKRLQSQTKIRKIQIYLWWGLRMDLTGLNKGALQKLQSKQ